MKNLDLITMGEIMLRLISVNQERIARGSLFQKEAGCAELNVAAAASFLGLNTALISKIPENEIGFFVRNSVRSFGVSDRYLLADERPDARLGVYYCENGAYPRKPKVVYDRKNSSIHSFKVSELPEQIFTETRCFHTSGIMLALSEHVRACTRELIKRFRASGALISFDVNYRANLWSGEEAAFHIRETLPYVDYLFCSADTARLTFHKEGDRKLVLQSFTEEFPNLKAVICPERTVHSPKLHSFSSSIYESEQDRFIQSEPYRQIDIIDRIGSGDAFVAGVLYGLLTDRSDLKRALRYGDAMCAVKCTIPYDIAVTGKKEIDALIAEHLSGGACLELSR